MSSYTPYPSQPKNTLSPLTLIPRFRFRVSQLWQVFAASVFLVAVPVFIQAPMVREFPYLSLGLTTVWLGLGSWLYRRPNTRLWGDLLIGFSWTWLAGSIYWGWLRWEPLWHLPVEALGLPVAIACLVNQRLQVGHWFYLGSLLGTVVTDIYFYVTDLIPAWRQLMQVDPQLAAPILHAALLQISSPAGIGWAIVLVCILLLSGCLPLRSRWLHSWAFAGAVLSTLVVDGLFWLAAIIA